MTTRSTQLAAIQIQHMADDKIRSMINPDALARIKRTDPAPEIRVYGVGHEGDAHGTMVGSGAKVIKYVQHAIRRLADRLLPGVHIFHRHSDTNAHEGRQPIGEVVGKDTVEINGKLHAVAAVYILPEFRSQPFDVASIEAEVAYSLDEEGSARVDDVEKVTGIALSSSAVDRPGFAGATLLGAMQAFAENPPRKGEKTMTLEEIRQAIKDGKLTPSDVFDVETLMADPKLSESVKTQVKEKVDKVEAYHERQLKKLEKLETENTELSNKLKEAETVAIVSKADKLFSGLATDRKLNDRQANYIRQRLDTFKPTGSTEDAAKQEMNSWVDEQLKSYQKDAELFGIKEEPVKSQGAPSQQPSKGAPSGDSSATTAEDPNNLTDPKANDFIP